MWVLCLFVRFRKKLYGRIGPAHDAKSEDFREFLRFFGHVRGTLRKLLWCIENAREPLRTSGKGRGRVSEAI